MEDFTAVFIMLTIVFGLVVIGGLCIVAYAFVSRQRMRELAVRERIAMIERGLVPAPEVDPLRFERAVTPVRRRTNSRAMRYRSAGVVLMGLGLALVVLLTFAAGEPEVAFGIGGSIAVLGGAVFVNGMLVTNGSDPDHWSVGAAENRRPEPPPNAGS